MNVALIKEEAGKIRNEYVRSVLIGAVQRDSPLAHLTEQTVWNIAKYIVELEEKAGRCS